MPSAGVGTLNVNNVGCDCDGCDHQILSHHTRTFHMKVCIYKFSLGQASHNFNKLVVVC